MTIKVKMFVLINLVFVVNPALRSSLARSPCFIFNNNIIR